MIADLYIKNGLDSNGKPIEIVINKGKIVAVSDEPGKLAMDTQQTLDLENKFYVSAGWIDSHVHANQEMELYYDYPDEIGVKTGVSTIVDAGSTGIDNIGPFYKTAKKAKTNVLAMLNISDKGIIAQNELDDLAKINPDQIPAVIEKYEDFIVGIKARMSRSVVGDMGIQPLLIAKEIQKVNNAIPLMVHIGNAPPELKDIIELLEKNDIITHCFNGKANSVLNDQNKVYPYIKRAQEKGVIFDIGHGTDSFSMEVAQNALDDGFKSNTISTDIYYKNRTNGPVYDMATTLEKLLYLGYSLNEIIRMITERPAEIFKLENKGKIKKGYDADLTVFSVKKGIKNLIDSEGSIYQTNKIIQPNYTIIAGDIIKVGDSDE